MTERNKKMKEVSETVKNLEVDKAEFDRVLKRLIGTPPIRKAPARSKRKSSR